MAKSSLAKTVQGGKKAYKSGGTSKSLKSPLTMNSTASRQRTPTLRYEPAPTTYRDNYTSSQRSDILARNFKKNGDFYTCENCGFKHKETTYATYKGKRMGDSSFQVDHKTPAAKGGMASKRNSAVLCGTCNTSKGKRLASKTTGMQKYGALHRGFIPKDYQRKPGIKK